MPFVKTNNLTIYYDEMGEGNPLIMLHAFPTDRTLWLFQTHVLSDYYRVISVDLRGFGKSEKQIPSTGITMKTLSDDIYDLLGVLQIDKTYMMGLSMGSLVTMQFALDHPDRLNRIILAGAFAQLKTKEIQETFDSWITILKTHGITAFLDMFYSQPVETQVGEGQGFAQEFITSKLGAYLIQDRKEKGANLDPNVLIEVIKGFKKFDLRTLLGQITIPTLIIAGEHELVAFMKEVHRLIPSSIMQIISGSGHFSCLDNPEKFNRNVLKFLQKQEA